MKLDFGCPAEILYFVLSKLLGTYYSLVQGGQHDVNVNMMTPYMDCICKCKAALPDSSYGDLLWTIVML